MNKKKLKETFWSKEIQQNVIAGLITALIIFIVGTASYFFIGILKEISIEQIWLNLIRILNGKTLVQNFQLIFVGVIFMGFTIGYFYERIKKKKQNKQYQFLLSTKEKGFSNLEQRYINELGKLKSQISKNSQWTEEQKNKMEAMRKAGIDITEKYKLSLVLCTTMMITEKVDLEMFISSFLGSAKINKIDSKIPNGLVADVKKLFEESVKRLNK